MLIILKYFNWRTALFRVNLASKNSVSFQHCYNGKKGGEELLIKMSRTHIVSVTFLNHI